MSQIFWYLEFSETVHQTKRVLQETKQVFAWRWQVGRIQCMCKCFYGCLNCSIYSITMGIVSKKKKKNHIVFQVIFKLQCVIQTSQLLIVAICPSSGSLHWKFMFEVQRISFSQLVLFMLKCSRLCISGVNPIFITSGHLIKNNFVLYLNEKKKKKCKYWLWFVVISVPILQASKFFLWFANDVLLLSEDTVNKELKTLQDTSKISLTFS